MNNYLTLTTPPNTIALSLNLPPSQQIYLARIEPLMEKLMREKEIYQQALDKTETLTYLLKSMQRFSPERFLAISDESLRRRVRRLMALKSISGLLSDLTPPEIKRYDEAVARA